MKWIYLAQVVASCDEGNKLLVYIKDETSLN